MNEGSLINVFYVFWDSLPGVDTNPSINKAMGPEPTCECPGAKNQSSRSYPSRWNEFLKKNWRSKIKNLVVVVHEFFLNGKVSMSRDFVSKGFYVPHSLMFLMLMNMVEQEVVKRRQSFELFMCIFLSPNFAFFEPSFPL